MGAALGADGGAAERAVLDPGHDLMGAVAVVERAQDLQVRLATVRAGGGIDDQVAGVSLVPSLLDRDLVETTVLPGKGLLLWGPVHTYRIEQVGCKGVGGGRAAARPQGLIGLIADQDECSSSAAATAPAGPSGRRRDRPRP